MNYNLSDAPLYPPQFAQFFANLGTSHILSGNIGHELLFGIWGIFLFFYAIVSIALFYHWYAYGMGNRYIFLAEISFGLVSALLFWTAFLIIVTI